MSAACLSVRLSVCLPVWSAVWFLCLSHVSQVGIFPSDEAMMPHVLIVEDSPLCAKLLRRMLVRAGCTVDCAENGAEARRRARAGFCVLLSLLRPSDGWRRC